MASKKQLNILLADDGSQHAQSAVELLRSIPLPPKSRIMVLRVFNQGQISAKPEFENALERTGNRLLSTGMTVETSLIMGSPSEEVIEMAKTRKSDLIVLGARGLRATLGILLGGVARQVVEYAGCPVLIVRAPYEGLRRILVVTDGSTHSQYAARYLGKFPLPDEVDVHVMHILPPLQPPVAMEPYLGGWHTIYMPLPHAGVTALQTNQERKVRVRRFSNGPVSCSGVRELSPSPCCSAVTQRPRSSTMLKPIGLT